MKDGVVKCKPLDMERFQEMGKTFVLPWLDMMGAYVAAGNSPINVMGCNVQNPS